MKISDEAVEAAERAYETFGAGMQDALEAALPYLAPAGDGGLREALEKLAEGWRYKGEFGWGPWQLGEGPDQEGLVLDDAAAEIRKLLAAHPAAPAVPQPVDREALIKWVGKTLTFEHFRDWSDEDFADAVLAVLAGEQEQVET